MSRTVRKLATDLDLLGCLYNFHFERFRKSIRSCLFNVRGLFVRKYTNCAITRSTARWRCGGHRRNCGRTSNSSGMYAAKERRIRAIMFCSRWRFLPHILLDDGQACPCCRILYTCPWRIYESGVAWYSLG